MFEQYDTIRALKEPDLYLIKDYKTGVLAVRKRTRIELLSLYHQLSNIHHKGMPKIFSAEQEGRYLTVIREYIPGKTLSEALLDGVSFTSREIKDIMVSLCDILSVMHGLTPPVIHRDIKPSNIILKEGGGICLIDFDAARQYKGDGNGDTQHIGTHGYAAPEQYGFGETDARADIYAAGILLKELAEKNGIADFKEIISVCTRMDPARRYQSAAELKRALLKGRRKGKAAVIGAAVLLLCGVIAVTFMNDGQRAESAIGQTQEEASVGETDGEQVQPENEHSGAVIYLAANDPTSKLSASPMPDEKADDPWLQIAYPGYNAPKSYSKIYDYAQLKEALNIALEEPDVLYEVSIEGDVSVEESMTLPLNMKLSIRRGSAMRMTPGTTLTIGGFLEVEGDSDNFATLELMDGSTLYCCNRPDEGLLGVNVAGRLQCGRNVTITRQEVTDQNHSPLIVMEDGSALRCEEVDSMSVSGYRLFFLASTAEFPMEVFGRTKGIGNIAEIRFYNIASLDEMLSALEDVKTRYRYFNCNVDISEDITIERDVIVPNNAQINLYLEGVELSIAEGAKFTVGISGMQLERDTKLMVLQGGTLNYLADGIAFAEGAGVYAEPGGIVNFANRKIAKELGFE